MFGKVIQKMDANILGGLHLKMPDCIGDVKVLKKPLEKNIQIVKEADFKIRQSVTNLQKGRYSQDGLTIASRFAGFFGTKIMVLW